MSSLKRVDVGLILFNAWGGGGGLITIVIDSTKMAKEHFIKALKNICCILDFS